jgi:hypothetical protein
MLQPRQRAPVLRLRQPSPHRQLPRLLLLLPQRCRWLLLLLHPLSPHLRQSRLPE